VRLRGELPILNVFGVLAAAWIIYASFYLCRVNFSIALPLIHLGLDVSHSQLGIIASGFFIVYAVGQILNGYLSAKFEPQKLVVIGIIGSSIVNVLFGLSGNFTLLLVLWMLNGYFQSLGWPTLVRVVSIIAEGRLGASFGLFNTSWAIGHVISWLLTGAIISGMDWRCGFTLNGLLFLAMGVPAALYLISKMGRSSGGALENFTNRRDIGKSGFELHFKMITLMALSFFIVDSIRYGLTVYLPSYIFSIEKATFNSTLISIVFPIAGSVGMLITGFASDKFRVEKKTLLVLGMSFATMTLIYMFPLTFQLNRLYGIVVLVVLSALLYAIESQITVIIPVEVVGEKHSSIAAGLINSIGALGAFTSSIISGIIIDIYGFIEVFRFWSYIQIPLILLLSIAYLSMRRH